MEIEFLDERQYQEDLTLTYLVPYWVERKDFTLRDWSNFLVRLVDWLSPSPALCRCHATVEYSTKYRQWLIYVHAKRNGDAMEM